MSNRPRPLFARACSARALGIVLVLGFALGAALPGPAHAHGTEPHADVLAHGFLRSLDDAQRAAARLDFEDPERHAFRWTPGERRGVRLDALSDAQRESLRDLFRSVLSEAGVRKVDAVIATEAALGVIENAREYRDPGKYWTAVFGQPGAPRWGLRFEGHHLSVNLTFEGDTLISATPLFLGANPETVPSGPDAGLRAMAAEVDGLFAIHDAMTDAERDVARGGDEWFGGFLTSPGERRANLGKPAGIRAADLSPAAQDAVRRLIDTWVGTMTSEFSAAYLADAVARDWPNLHVYWRGGAKPDETVYVRIAGKRLLIEHDGRSGGRHVHAIWRDARTDFGG